MTPVFFVFLLFIFVAWLYAGSTKNKESYKNIVDLWDYSPSTVKNEDSKGRFVGVYGELTSKGTKKMLKNINTKGLVFCDLGCGNGAAMKYADRHGKWKKVIGVEIVPSRVREARKSLKGKKFDIREGSLFDNKHFEDADVYYVSNLLFTNKMQKELGQRFNERKKKGRFVVFSSRPLEVSKKVFLRAFNLKQVKQSWSEDSSVIMSFLRIK